MKLSQIALVGALAAVSSAAPAPQNPNNLPISFPVPEEAKPNIVCETSGTSPFNEHILDAIVGLKKKFVTDCKNKNKFGSKCSTVFKTGTAAVGICGRVDDRKHGIPCGTVGNFVDYIMQTCQTNKGPAGQAGGMYNPVETDETHKVVLFNTKDSFAMAAHGFDEAEVAAIADSAVSAESS